MPIWVTLTLTLTSGLIYRFFVSRSYLLYYSYFFANVSYARSIPLGEFVMCLISCFKTNFALFKTTVTCVMNGTNGTSKTIQQVPLIQ